MRHRMPSRMKGRDVRLEIIPAEDRDLTVDGIAQVWALMHERRGDGRWWSVGRELDVKQIRRLYAGIYNRAWYAGYNKSILEVHTSKLDGLCFQWAPGAVENPAIAENKAKRMKKHSQTVGAYLKRVREEKKA